MVKILTVGGRLSPPCNNFVGHRHGDLDLSLSDEQLHKQVSAAYILLYTFSVFSTLDQQIIMLVTLLLDNSKHNDNIKCYRNDFDKMKSMIKGDIYTYKSTLTETSNWQPTDYWNWYLYILADTTEHLLILLFFVSTTQSKDALPSAIHTWSLHDVMSTNCGGSNDSWTEWVNRFSLPRPFLWYDPRAFPFTILICTIPPDHRPTDVTAAESCFVFALTGRPCPLWTLVHFVFLVPFEFRVLTPRDSSVLLQSYQSVCRAAGNVCARYVFCSHPLSPYVYTG